MSILQEDINLFIDKYLSKFIVADFIEWDWNIPEGGGIPRACRIQEIFFDNKEPIIDFLEKNKTDVSGNTYIKLKILKNDSVKDVISEGVVSKRFDGNCYEVTIYTNWHDMPTNPSLSGKIRRGTTSFASKESAEKFIDAFNQQKFDNETCENRAILEENK